MNLLDEQIRADQRELLMKWRIPFRQVGRELASFGVRDENIIPLLLKLKRPTLFTHDQGFFKRSLLHQRYSLIWLDVEDIEAAGFIRRILRHPLFNTHASRLGRVIRVHSKVIHFWEATSPRLQTTTWQVN